jgi:hypothetical protein
VAQIASSLINGRLASIERPRNQFWREFSHAVAQIRQIRKMREDLRKPEISDPAKRTHFDSRTSGICSLKTE